jgi:IS5 family transposase
VGGRLVCGRRGTGRRRRGRHVRAVRRRHVRARPKGGHEVGTTKVGKGVKVELVTDAAGVPVGAATAGANVPEAELIGPALDSIPEAVELPAGVPVVTDRAYDSDPLRAELAEDGFRLLSPHRKNRKRPPTNDGRRMRRYKRRWVVERTIGWLHSFRRLLVRHEYYSIVFDGFVHLALALITLPRF